MGWFRSEEMKYVSLIMQEDSAHGVVEKLGRMGVVQFADLNQHLTAFQRRYVNYIKRCDEMERKLRYFETELSKFEIEAQVPLDADHFMRSPRLGQAAQPGVHLLDSLEALFEEKERDVQVLNGNIRSLTREYNEKVELKCVLERSRQFFHSTAALGSEQLLEGVDMDIRFNYIAGVLDMTEQTRFERMVFRATRGNCFVQMADIDRPLLDPQTNQPQQKVVFVIMYRARAIENKLAKICEAFGARRHAIPDLDNDMAVGSRLREVASLIDDSRNVLARNRDECARLLREIAEDLVAWQWTVKKEKAVYHTLNKFRPHGHGMLHAEGWVVARAFDEVNQAVHGVGEQGPMDGFVTVVNNHNMTPPTYFETNKFTSAFQGLVDTYGVPRYREANPAMFTAVTFPFLFGMMYGDVGHALAIFAAALYMVLNERALGRSNMSEIFRMAFNGRYMLLLMGFFGVYCGMVYNDTFSLGMDLFGSRWKFPPGNETVQATRVAPGAVYPFGVDPVWHAADNDLNFFNSLKMKMSVIFGVSQMTFGLFLKLSNAVHFRQPLDVLFECIPQLLFMLGLFGYMNFLIIFKWCTDWSKSTLQPPSLINTLIGIALSPGSVDEPLYDKSTQESVQTLLLLVALLSVPVMLFPKPIILYLRHRRAHAASSLLGRADEEVGFQALHDGEEAPAAGAHAAADHEHSIGELFIHQTIETIEFVLGTVSNTASYLRLWALSLAHSELARVFWERSFAVTLEMETNVVVRAFAIVIGFGAFAAVTTGVLLMMDTLECFLHALRLHWVEFQNKFYKADGYKFRPFSFKAVLTAAADE